MQILRIDHVHMKSPDFDKTAAALEKFLGREFFFRNDFTEDNGAEVAYEPYPIGIELFRPTDASKISGGIASAASVGMFSIAFKVPDIKEAQAEMKSLGYKILEHYDFGDIQETLFDTKDALGVYMELIEYPGDSMVG